MPRPAPRKAALMLWWRILSASLFLLLACPQALFAQAVFQPPDRPLFVPSLIQTADDALAGITIASLPRIPFTATVEIENRTISPTGAVTVHRLTGKIARDAHGSLRTVVDLNVVGKPYDRTQVTIHIHDAQRKADITLFPAASSPIAGLKKQSRGLHAIHSHVWNKFLS